MLLEYNLSVQKEGFFDITPQAREAVSESGVKNGVLVVERQKGTYLVSIKRKFTG